MFLWKTVLITLLLGYVTYYFINYFSKSNNKNTNDIAFLDLTQLIKHFDYPLEIHEVLTDDGYILTLHRIPHGKTESGNTTKNIPVLLMHGAMDSGAQFVRLGPVKALSFLLADRNYDVWLANARGTTWSRKHTRLDPDKDQAQFWNYSFHEIGVFDVTATIDYILKETQQSQLHYIGYSQGTQVMFVMASEKPDYVKRIRLMTALAPAIYVQNIRSPFAKPFTYFHRTVEKLYNYYNIHKLPSNHVLQYWKILRNICDENSILVSLCLHQIFLVYGYSYEQTNLTMLPLIFHNTPEEASKQFNHNLQMSATGRFAKYDFGPTDNMIRYGQIDAPTYDLSRATMPVAVYHSLNDWICSPKDVERTIAELPNVVKKYVVPHADFNHNDFVHGKDADTLLYNEVIAEIEKY